MKKWLKAFWAKQTVSWYNVRAYHSFDRVNNTFHLFSSAGYLRYRALSERDISRFRDKYINWFDYVIRHDEIPTHKRKREYLGTYRKIRKQENWACITYRSNVRTWLRYRAFW